MLTGWQDWFGTITGVVVLTIAALPVAALATWTLAHRRTTTGQPFAWRRSLAEVGLIYGTIPWVWMILLPNRGATADRRRVNLIPLHDLIDVLASGPLTATIQIVGNLLVFAALGFFAPIRFAALASLPRILAVAAACSIVVETAQYVLGLDRVSSVDDVLLNAAGAVLAALVSRRWWRSRSDSPGTAGQANSGSLRITA